MREEKIGTRPCLRCGMPAKIYLLQEVAYEPSQKSYSIDCVRCGYWFLPE